MGVDGLLEEMDGRLTGIWVRYPETKPFIMSYQKHIRYALQNPGKVKVHKLMVKGRAWLLEMKWKHPIFQREFGQIIDAMDKFEKG